MDKIKIIKQAYPEYSKKNVRKSLQGVQDRLRDRKIRLTIEEDAVEWLAVTGLDPLLGARPLERCVEKNVTKPLARLLLEDQVAHKTIVIGLHEDEIVVRWRVDSLPSSTEVVVN